MAMGPVRDRSTGQVNVKCFVYVGWRKRILRCARTAAPLSPVLHACMHTLHAHTPLSPHLTTSPTPTLRRDFLNDGGGSYSDRPPYVPHHARPHPPTLSYEAAFAQAAAARQHAIAQAAAARSDQNSNTAAAGGGGGDSRSAAAAAGSKRKGMDRNDDEDDDDEEEGEATSTLLMGVPGGGGGGGGGKRPRLVLHGANEDTNEDSTSGGGEQVESTLLMGVLGDAASTAAALAATAADRAVYGGGGEEGGGEEEGGGGAAAAAFQEESAAAAAAAAGGMVVPYLPPPSLPPGAKVKMTNISPFCLYCTDKRAELKRLNSPLLHDRERLTIELRKWWDYAKRGGLHTERECPHRPLVCVCVHTPHSQCRSDTAAAVPLCVCCCYQVGPAEC